jgi:hypothetical protein
MGLVSIGNIILLFIKKLELVYCKLKHEGFVNWSWMFWISSFNLFKNLLIIYLKIVQNKKQQFIKRR